MSQNATLWFGHTTAVVSPYYVAVCNGVAICNVAVCDVVRAYNAVRARRTQSGERVDVRTPSAIRAASPRLAKLLKSTARIVHALDLCYHGGRETSNLFHASAYTFI